MPSASSRKASSGSTARSSNTPPPSSAPTTSWSSAASPVGAAERTRLFRYHKPDGLVTTHKDPEGRPTVFDKLKPSGLPRVVSVGRLDLNSEGLLLLTNDGALARKLELPSNGWTRRYRVRAWGAIDERALAGLARGISVEGVKYGPIEASLESQAGDNAWISVALDEGRNREVRRVMAHLGLVVNRLIRVSYGPFQLGRLPRGAVDEVPGKVLREQMGLDKPAPKSETAMRIIAGAWRGRKLIAPDGEGTRPTADRVRQALFDRLLHAAWAGRDAVEDAHVLDAFAGTGSLGLEALSRGAARAVFIEKDPAASRPSASTSPPADGRGRVLAGDALRPPPGQPCTLIFLDPPYGLGLVPRAVAALDAAGWIAPNALVVAEIGNAEMPDPAFELVMERRHGAGRMTAWRHCP